MKLDLILENTRNRYALGLLEESEGMSEKDLLKGKILINESTMKIRKMLVEEGTIAQVQTNLEEAWTAALIQEFEVPDVGEAWDSVKSTVGDAYHSVMDSPAQAAVREANLTPDVVAAQTAAANAEPVVAKPYTQTSPHVGDRLAGIEAAKTATYTAPTTADHLNSGGLTTSLDTKEAPSKIVQGGQQLLNDGKVAINNAITTAPGKLNNAVASVKAAVAPVATSAGQALDAASQYAQANKGIVGAGVAGAGLAGYGALNAGRNLAGVVRRR